MPADARPCEDRGWPGTDMHTGEKIEDLQCGNLKIIARRDGFHYGTDSVLLANFVKPGTRGHIVELCSGTGAVSILLSAKTRAAKITGIEIDEYLTEMSNRSVALNGIGGKVEFICGDIRGIRRHFPAGCASAVAANPPYIRLGSGPPPPGEGDAAARHETMCTLPDVAGAAEWLLKNGGSLYIVHRPDRLADLIHAMRSAGVEPKELRPAGSSAGRPPSIILIRGIKGAKPGLRWLPQSVEP